jgi:hypothetical protein
MKRKRWQVAAIDSKLFRLRQKHKDPETNHVNESDPEGGFYQEWKAWCAHPEQSWLYPDAESMAVQTRRDNIERHPPRLDEGDTLIWDPQMVLPLNLDEGVTVQAENVRVADWNDFLAVRQTKVDEHVDAHGRLRQAVDREKAKYQRIDERWIDVQKRSK